MKEYSVYTYFGTQFNYVISWEPWEFDKEFVKFIQKIRGEKKELILRQSEIKYISE